MSYSIAKGLLGLITVEESGKSIIIEGIPMNNVLYDMSSEFRTSRLGKYMLSSVSSRRAVFNRFFAIDVLYMLEALAKSPHTRCASRVYTQVANLMREETWLRQLCTDVRKPDILDFSRVSEINLPLLKHQREFLEFYNRSVPSHSLKGMLLAAAPGSGKTITGLALASCLEADAVIIVSPKNAVERVWAATIRDNLVKKPDYWYSTSGTRPPLGLRYYVFHYESLAEATWLASKSKWRKPVIILDESHNFNETTSLRTQTFIELCQSTNCKHVLWSSGTPIKAVGYEAIPLLRTIDPYFDQNAEKRFRKIFTKSKSGANDILANRLGYITFKVDKTVVAGTVHIEEYNVKIPTGTDYTLDAIREKMRNFIAERREFYDKNMSAYIAYYNRCLSLYETEIDDIERTGDYRLYQQYVTIIRKGYDARQHGEMAKFCNRYELQYIIPTLPEEHRKKFKEVRTIIKYVQLKIMGEALGGILGKARAQCHVDMIPGMGIPEFIESIEKKTIIFTSYVEVADKMVEYLTKLGYKPALVHGGTNKDLPEIVRRFGDDKSINPLVATYQSLSTAVPLIMANGIVMTNAPFRDYEEKQAIARCDRLGQDRPVYIRKTFLDTNNEPNISTRSKDILEWSEDMVASIMGVETPPDLSTTLESFADNTQIEMTESAKRFSASIRDKFPSLRPNNL